MATDIDAILARRTELARLHPGTILLFRVEDELGEWYRAYGDDAKAIDFDTIIGGIRFVLSHFSADDRRWIGIAPEDLEAILDRIVKAGKRAAVCEQVTGTKAIKASGKQVERIVTPGSMEDWLRISREVREAGGLAEEALCRTCDREWMSRTAVIKAYGDPREWPEVERVVGKPAMG